MQELVVRFADHLRVEKRASVHTQRAYLSNVGQFLGFIGEKRERVDPKVVERLDIALDAYRDGVVGIALRLVVALVLELRAETRQAPLPSVASADDCSIDEKTLPEARRAKRAQSRVPGAISGRPGNLPFRSSLSISRT